MSIFLAGAGPDPQAFPGIFDRFADDVRRHAGPGRTPRVAVAVHPGGGSLQDILEACAGPLRTRLGGAIVAVPLAAGSPADPTAFSGADGVVVGGGLTPAYWEGLRPAAAAVSRLVAGGTPYLGFSAGAMVAPRRALIGGYRINGVEVCGEECGEGLDAVDVRDGLGLVPFALDVHAAQAGTLSRAVGAVAAGLVERMVAIDEGTAVVLEAAGAGDYRVIGSGNCWDIRQTGGTAAVSVSVRAAG
ncbi:Type 1 glutamine amidotransferase-like domain-containing protein [Pseudarthrobacter sp. C4D7]|uniref:Type 1 glutamine amidotransferase-like domain-containing protein n=1 Tax=Pseudarthrobacter sp. C4D7 TaxID=2735268 RepID=UPI001584BA25|nr:Type 1 glutamine amidotransferase-like domain-containing protein [Pseudarthrobacter sp. C4D7]NUT71614.1 type 1 glutamine amidotransferase-like domain-containing protein [Pseudarthrobacter sp. C4D7]